MSKRLVACYDCKAEKPRRDFMSRTRDWKKVFPEYKDAEERLGVEHPGEDAKARDARYVGLCFTCFYKRSWAKEAKPEEPRPPRISMAEVISLFEEQGLRELLFPRTGPQKAVAKLYMPEEANVEQWQLFDMRGKMLADGKLPSILREARLRGWF